MKAATLKILFSFLVVLATVKLSAQCPPPGFPQPGNTCPQAPVLCDNIDGYCATVNNNNVVQPFPGCPNNVLNNDEWFAFFAGTTTITIQITPSNCNQSNNMGLQGGIYGGCINQIMDVQCPCTTNPFLLTSNNFVVGQIYWLVIDGCAGNVCDYSVAVLAGSTVPFPPGNPGPISGPTTVCVNSSNNYSITPPTGATQYTWTLTPALGTVNGTTNNISVSWGNTAGTAQLCVQVANFCEVNSTQSCTTIVVDPSPTATLSGTGILCKEEVDTVFLTVSFTGVGPWTFTPVIAGVAQPPITTSSNPYLLPVTTGGTVSIQSVTSGNANCPGTVSGTVTINEIDLNFQVQTTASTCGQSNGGVNLTVNGGQAPYTYSWSNGANTEDLANIPSGTYTVTVTDSNGCSETTTATVANNPITINISGAVTANTTCNGGNGAIDISVTPTGNTYVYNWSNGATTQDISNLTPGSYTVTVSLGTTCSSTATFTVPNQPNQPNVSSTTTPSICELANGDINITVSGGVPPYTYNWSNGATTEDINDVMPGSYTVTVTGANGCTTVQTITLNNNNPPINITGSVNANTTCNGGNGSVSITITPASPPAGGNYTITWNNGGNGTNLNNLTPGTYTVTVDGGGACSQTASFTIPDQPNLPQVSSNTTPSVCAQANGDIDITVTGGVTPYTYNWSNGATTQDINDVNAGSYTVTVTGANGCSTVQTITLTNNNPNITINPTVMANTTCNGGNGSISITISPSSPPNGGSWSINWSNGSNNTNLTNLTPGTYSVTVDGGGACTQTANITVPNQPNVPSVSANTTPAYCQLANGDINTSVSGGVSPYTYLWSNGATTPNLIDVVSGSYTVTVTGANGCTTVNTFTISENNIPITITGNVIANTACSSSNGSITITVTPNPPATGSYTYTWSNGGNGTNLTNLAPGSYTVTVSAGGSCTQTATFTVPNQPNQPAINSNVTPANCGLSNGSITVSVTGGVQPFTYAWSNGGNTNTISNVPAGTYTVTVTGGNGCTSSAPIAIPNDPINFTVSNNITPNTACVGANGGIILSVTPPSPPTGSYTYTWNTGATTANLSNLAPGNYTVTVSAGGTCTQVLNYTVPQNAQLPVFSTSVTPGYCGLPTGSINLSLSAGLPPITFQWSNGMTTEDLNNIIGGTYTVTVTGQVGCTATGNVNVPNNTIPYTVTGITTGNSSCTNPNGQIVLNMNPQTPPQGPGYSYQWNTGPTSPFLTNLAPGTYTVTVSAGGTCTQVQSYEVFNFAFPPQLSLSPVAATCGSSNGAVNMTITSGDGPYSYNWSNGANSQNLSNVTPGTYTVTLTAGNGCTATASATVANNNPAINISGTPTPNTSCSANNGAIDISVSPAGNNYTYNWSNGATTQDINNLAPGSYTVTVTAGTSCTATKTYTVVSNTADPDLTAAITAAICGEANGGIDLSVSSGQSPYTYSWSNGATTQDLGNVLPGNYTVTVTDANGCSSTETFNVQNNSSSFTLSGNELALTSCAFDNGSIDLNIDPAGTYDVLWSNGATTEDLDSLAAGTYTVTVTDPASGGCSAEASFTIVDDRTYPELSESVSEAQCGEANGSIDLSINGGAQPYTISWSNGSSTEDLNNIFSGDYGVTVTGANGCADSLLTVVPEITLSISIDGSTSANTSCATPTGAVNISVSPAGNYIYTWSNGATTEDISGVAGGNYSVTVSAGGTCTAEAAFTVTTTTAEPILAQALTPTICGVDNGAIDLSVSNGAEPYTFVWSNGASTEDLSGIVAGNYSVTVTGANGCTKTASLTLPNNDTNFDIAGTATANTLCNGGNGGLDITVTPAAQLGYSFAWSNGATTEDLSSLPQGSYTVTVTEGNTCSAEATFVVPNNTTAPNLSTTPAAAFCGTATGGVDMSISGGVPPFNIAWDNGATTEDLSNLLPSTYEVTVTGDDGCASTASATVNDNVLNIQLAATTNPNTACASGNGTLDLQISPAGTYTINWDSSDTVQQLINLVPGTYTVTVSTGNTCSAEQTFTIDDQPDLPQLSQQITADVCSQGVGGIDLSVSGGGGTPYQFNWSNGATSEDLNSIASGMYDVTVTSANGCSATTAIDVPNNSSTFSIAGTASPNTLCGSPNGGIDLTVSPPSNYTYQWSNGATSEDLSDVPPGPYTVTVSDGGTCTATATYTVDDQSAAPALSGNPSHVLCFGEATGSIDLTVSGGTTPFDYVWSPAIAGTLEDPANLPAGNYTVTVSDGAGCSSTMSFAINQPPSAVGISCSQTVAISLPGASDGEASISIVGGVLPYTVTWTPGGSQSGVGVGNFAISNLAEGTYDILVVDANGCEASCQIEMTTVSCLTAIGSMQNSLQAICGEGCISAVYDSTLQYLEGDDILQFVLHTGNNNVIVGEIARNDEPYFCFDAATMTLGTTYYISAIAGNDDGSGNVDLNDDCSKVSAGTPIVFRPVPEAAIQQPDPLNCEVKQTNLKGSSSLPGSTFTWFTNNGLLIGNTANATANAGAAGTYELVVNLNGCKDTVAVDVVDETTLVQAFIDVDPANILDCTVQSVILTGSATGSANPTFKWVNSDVIVSTQNPIVIDYSGIFDLIVLDTVTFCLDTATVEIIDGEAYPPLDVDPPAALSCKQTVVTLSGSSPAPAVELSWAIINGTDTTIIDTGPTTDVTAPGTYYLIGIDPNNGCSNIQAVGVLADLANPNADAGNPFTIDCLGEEKHLDGTGSTGIGPITYLWTTNDGDLQAGVNSAAPTIGSAGTYQLTVTNIGNGCSDTDQVLVSADAPVVEPAVYQPACLGDKGTIYLGELSGGTPPYLFSYDGGQTFTEQSIFPGLEPDIYNVVVQDAVGCEFTTQLQVQQPQIFDLQLDSYVEIQQGESYQINTQVTIPLSEIDSIWWSPTQWLSCTDCLNPVATPETTTLYKITAISNKGCEDSDHILLVISKGKGIYVPNAFSPNNDGTNDELVIYADPDKVTEIKSFLVFSRWGETVFEYHHFEPNNPAYGWDGTHRGQLMNPAVFAWFAIVEFADGTEQLFEGDVTLMR